MPHFDTLGSHYKVERESKQKQTQSRKIPQTNFEGFRKNGKKQKLIIISKLHNSNSLSVSFNPRFTRFLQSNQEFVYFQRFDKFFH